MKMLLRFWFWPLFGFFFAAADTGLDAADSGAAEAPPAGGDSDLGLEFDSGSTEESAETTQPEQRTEPQQTTEEPEVQEFKGAVSARLRGLVKQSPKLAEAFKENPKLQEQIEATFRREAALREVFPTVAEARQMREHFPNGLADVQQLQADVKEVEELDNDFYVRDQEGNYPGHAKILDNMFRDDRNAAVSLFKTLPKEWARLDRDSYNEVMGRIVGATISSAGIVEFLGELSESAGDNKNLKAGLQKLANWAQGFLTEKPKPSADEERLSRDRANFDREKAERSKQEGEQFKQSFNTANLKLQRAAIQTHPAVQRLMANKTISDQKKTAIIEQVRQEIQGLLSKSPSFMRKLRPAYESRNMDEATKIQKAAWSEQWRLNSAIRKVFNKEIPQLVSANRESVRRRTGAPQPGSSRPASVKTNTEPTGPKQIGGRWYRDGGKGAPFTTAEVLAGKHLS